eukprot:GFUD01033432.1.p1 GENE.GFUD01033432.1~~GFUD01033432.1.p1  ORF type:complete len:1083 (-),score=392.27 GFUD01033432.1:570-3818(-)
MSEDASNMEVDDPKTTDIPALKEAAKEVMEKVESEVNGDKDAKNGDKVNGFVANGDTCPNGNGEEVSSQKEEEKDEEMEVEAPSTPDNQNGDSVKDSEVKSSGDTPSKSANTTADVQKEQSSESSTDTNKSSESDNEKLSKSDETKDTSNKADDKEAETDKEVETINDSPLKKTPTKKKDEAEEPLRRSSRKKTPTKYHELLIKEMEMESPSEEEIEEVEEIKDDDSDIQEIEAEDPLGGESSLSITPKHSKDKKPSVVTIDDLKTLQRLATSAKQSVDKAKSDNLMIIDTQSIIAGKMGSGVSITPAKPKTLSTLSTPSTPSGLNISPAGLTLGSGVTIKPNKPSVGQGVSITPAGEKTSSSSSALSDPNLTDDTFVVEAPSFIVPYVYEKPPKEGIRDFKESIDKQIADKKKAKAKKKAAGEEVSDDEEVKEKKPEKKADEDEKEKTDEKEEEEEKEKKEEVKDAYFTSTLGKFFIDLGMNFVQEYVQKDLLRQQQRRSVKDKSIAVIHAIKSLQNNLDDSKDQNESFHFDLKKCKFCSFRTESRLVMQHHMETPHMRNFIYRCNFCEFETKIPQEVLYHMDSEHGVKGKLERAPYFHQCPQCPFEDNGKGKLTRHKVGCDKRFKSETNQTAERDWDPPAKIRPPPVRPGYTGYMNSRPGVPAGLGQGILRPGSSLLPRGQQFQQNSNRFMNNRNINNSANRGRPVGSYKGQADLRIPQPQLSGLSQQQLRMRGMSPQMLASQQMLAVLNQQGLSVSGGSGRNNMMIGGMNSSGSVTIQSLGQKGQNKNNSPSISITPLPGRNNPGQKSKGASPSPSSASTPTIKPGQPGAGQGGKGNFVICEICDGYIKDLEQLRNHMQWIHKVKIHPKMIYNRPPLNCQKCQFRFFTDQGLERHLLGSHGLVTASMQDAANKGQDSGRCPVCGKVYQWKLLNHVAKDHGKTLKPAHLSYKCTVCTATFGQYKLFENHVYTAHSGVAKKGDKNKQVAKSGSGSVLKAPVKLSDEISIIPTKKGDKDKEKKSEVIDLDDEEEIDDVEKEVIDLDTPKKDKKEDTSKRARDESSEEPEAKKAKAEDEEKKD